MFEFIRAHQLNIMLLLCGACGILSFLLLITRFLSRGRRNILILMELIAMFLLWFDRQAYIYAGNPGLMGFVMVRASNFMVFFLTASIVFVFNMYLMDWLTHEGGLTSPPQRLRVVQALSAIGMMLAVISSLTNLYYYFDESNNYHRGTGFLIAYIIPVLCPIIQYTVIRQHRKVFGRMIYITLVLYIFVPIVCGIIQIFTYGISIVNIAMSAVSISLYVTSYIDLNNTVECTHATEMRNMRGEQNRMRRLFDQTANAFVSAVEKKDDFTKENSVRIAEYARKIAELGGKSEEDCEKVYYAALFHDVGMIGIPDSVIKNEADPGKWDRDAMRQKPVIGEEILSSITEYPYLSQGAHYSHERYNGTGYPDGLSGEQIPEIARIIAVADAYVTMTSKKRYRDARPVFMAREAFVKGAGEEFDPVYAGIMVQIIDAESIDTNGQGITQEDARKVEQEIVCNEYREHISTGIPVENNFIRISFECDLFLDADSRFSAPSIVLFDSYDGRTHNNEKAIRGYHYLEYGEIWFDKYSITTAARKIEEKIAEDNAGIRSSGEDSHYEIIAGRYEDHLKLVMRSNTCVKKVIAALPSGSKAAYIGLTGENCRLRNISVQPTEEFADHDNIPRIAKRISYTDHLESDIKNIQVDRPRSASTEGVEIKNRLKLVFHTMSLPASDLVWHCPYVVIYSSDDGSVGGTNYHEYALIKLNGEIEESPTVYAALTGDQVALTDIRIM